MQKMDPIVPVASEPEVDEFSTTLEGVDSKEISTPMMSTRRSTFLNFVTPASEDDNSSVVSGMTQSQRRESFFGTISERRIQLVMQLDEHMFAPVSDNEMLEEKEAQALLLKSTFHPEVLLGWKVI